MFEIKICGITTVSDALACSQFGADAIGLNFYERSKRSVSIELASALVSELPGSLLKVGVFVDHEPHEVNEIASRCQLDAIQLHGDQPIEFVYQLQTSLPVIRAISWSSLAEVRAVSNEWIDAGASAILLDSKRGKQFGGTGKTIDWSEVVELNLPVPVILAGGLTPLNIKEAIETTQVSGVDTASGVESIPGKKDHELLNQFISTARTTLDRFQ